MRIIIQGEQGKDVRIWLPTGLMCNRLTAGAAAQMLCGRGLAVTRKQVAAFLRALNQYRHKHPEGTLVELQTQNGEYVQIKL